MPLTKGPVSRSFLSSHQFSVRYFPLLRNDLSCAWNSGSLDGRKLLGSGKPLSSRLSQGDVCRVVLRSWGLPRTLVEAIKTEATIKHRTRRLLSNRICMG